MMPSAPARLSMTVCWPSRAVSFCADVTAEDVVAAARRERHDDADGFGGISGAGDVRALRVTFA